MEVFKIFYWSNSSGCTMALGLTRPLTEMSTRNLPGGGGGGKGGRCLRLTTLPYPCAECVKILGSSNFWSPRGLSRSVQGQLYPYLHTYIALLWAAYLTSLLGIKARFLRHEASSLIRIPTKKPRFIYEKYKGRNYSGGGQNSKYLDENETAPPGV
jgi:hypothetical protein